MAVQFWLHTVKLAREYQTWVKVFGGVKNTIIYRKTFWFVTVTFTVINQNVFR
jgi:hypothetical protein